jgi:hypothetical protein
MGAVSVCSNWKCVLHRTVQCTGRTIDVSSSRLVFFRYRTSDVQYRSPLMGCAAVCVITY